MVLAGLHLALFNWMFQARFKLGLACCVGLTWISLGQGLGLGLVQTHPAA